MKTPLIDSAYQPHEWELLHVVDYATRTPKEGAPVEEPSRLNVFSVDSPMAESLEKRMRSFGGDIPSNVFLYDLEILATGGDHDVSSSAHVAQLAEDYKGYPAQSVVMTVFHTATTHYVYVAK